STPMPETTVTHSSADSRTQPVLRPRFAWLSDTWLVRLFLTPTMVLLLLIAIFPLIWSLYLSFTQYSVIKDAATGPKWIGLRNYAQLLADPSVWERFKITG